jgi:hypothetical protein
VHLFSPFGNVTVIWINEMSAFVALRDKNVAATVLGRKESLVFS